MRWSSLRRTLLSAVARVLTRWLNAVSAQLETAALAEPADPRKPTSGKPEPPDHWVELVRQHAPELLDADASDAASVIDYRADEFDGEPPHAAAPTPKARPLHLLTPQHRPPAPVSTVRTTAKRSLRLERVTAQALGAEPLNERASAEGEAVVPPSVETAARPVDVPRRDAPANAPAMYPPVRETSLERRAAAYRCHPDAARCASRDASVSPERESRSAADRGARCRSAV